jgi:hypothetical protein
MVRRSGLRSIAAPPDAPATTATRDVLPSGLGSGEQPREQDDDRGDREQQDPAERMQALDPERVRRRLDGRSCERPLLVEVRERQRAVGHPDAAGDQIDRVGRHHHESLHPHDEHGPGDHDARDEQPGEVLSAPA